MSQNPSTMLECKQEENACMKATKWCEPGSLIVEKYGRIPYYYYFNHLLHNIFTLIKIFVPDAEIYYKKLCITKGIQTQEYSFFPSHFNGCSVRDPFQNEKNITCYEEVCVCHEDKCNNGVKTVLSPLMCVATFLPIICIMVIINSIIIYL